MLSLLWHFNVKSRHQYIRSLSLGAKLGVLQGSKEGELLIDSIGKFFYWALYSMAFPISVLRFTPIWYAMVKHMGTVGTIVKRKVEEAIERNEKDNSLAGTVLEKLILRCGKDSAIPIVMSMDALGAGIDSTGNQSSFLLYHLAMNPDKQEKLSQEIKEVVGADGKMTEEKLAQMRYLKACQTESQRLASVAAGTVRLTQVSYVNVLAGKKLSLLCLIVQLFIFLIICSIIAMCNK